MFDSKVEPQPMPSNVGIVYLGKKGAGLQLTQWIIDFYEKESLGIFVCGSKYASPELKLIESDENLVLVETFRSLINFLFSPLKSFKTANVIGKLMLERNIRVVIFPMMHVWDLIIINRLRKQDLKVISMIHDDKAHKGEIFPPRWFVRQIIKRSDGLVFFSETVKSRLKTSDVEIFVCSLPVLIKDGEQKPSNLVKDGLLFLGRIKDYKGIPILLEAYKLMPEPRMNLTIAGEGNVTFDINTEVTFINRWLTNREVIDLLNKSKVLILPYTEATQSGVIPIAIDLRVGIVYSDVGGLSEQLSSYDRKVRVRPSSVSALRLGIQRAINGAFDPHNPEKHRQLGPVLIHLAKHGKEM